MRLIIAEKPSLARAIAEVLPHPHVKKGSFIECGASDVVAWCAGHILELAAPEEYAAEYKTWSLQHLPIVPQTWKLSPSAPDLLKTIKLLLPKAARVVHAGDPDREGQLLVDEVLDYLGYRGQVERLLVSDLNPPAVRKALDTLKPNGQFRSLYQAALARQRADWLYGLNLTRLYTVLGRAGGYDGVLSIGRVQTPLLGLIVRRDLEIEQFQPQPYFVIRADVSSGESCRFHATWQPPAESQEGFDSAGHLVDDALAAAVRKATTGRPGRVSLYSCERKEVSPPLPYSLPELQVDAARRLRLSPKVVLDLCQSLYETHRLITYPRSDCSHLPEGHHSQFPEVFAALVETAPHLRALAEGADTNLRSTAFCDAKVSAHHAIVPTASSAKIKLSDHERSVYDLVARRYLSLFYPHHQYEQTRITIEVGGYTFCATGRQPGRAGWHVVYAPLPDELPRDEGGENEDQALPLLVKDQSVSVTTVDIVVRKTNPPRPFTHASLIQAMTGISRFVSDPQIKRLLKEADGIGTPATQASIVQTLFDRHYVVERGRAVVSTSTGRGLVNALPPSTTLPDMTALWEGAMRQIVDGKLELDAFLSGVARHLSVLVEQGKKLGALRLPGVAPPKPCTSGCGGLLRLRHAKNGPFWGCTNYPECKQTQPAIRQPAAASAVPRRRRAQEGRRE